MRHLRSRPVHPRVSARRPAPGAGARPGDRALGWCASDSVSETPRSTSHVHRYVSKTEIAIIRSDWVLNHARNQIIATFHQLRAIRVETHHQYLQTLPYYTLYTRYNGQPPLQPADLQLVRAQIHQATQLLQAGVDQDWRASCLRYPEVLDYYFGLVQIDFPGDADPTIVDPRFGGRAMGMIDGVPTSPRKTKERRRKSIEMAMPERRRWRSGRTPPPQVPMPRGYRR